MAEDKFKMQKRLYNKFKAAGFSDSDYKAIMNDFMKTYGGDFASDLEAMDRDTFDALVKDRILPYAQESLDMAATKYPNQKEHLGKLGTGLTKVLDPWTRERFLNTMLRKGEEKMVDGKMVKGPAHIGHIGPLDRNLLRAEGLDDDEIAYYANKFSQEYMDKVREEAYAEAKENQAKKNADAQKEFLKLGWTDGVEGMKGVDAITGAVANLQRILGQELYAELYNSIGDPASQPDTWYEWLWNHKGAFAKDAARNALAALSFIVTKNPIATGALMGGTELAANLASDNYETNPSQAVSSGVAAGTLPFIAEKAMSAVTKVPMPWLSAAARDARKVILRNKKSPAELERDAFAGMASKAAESAKAAKTKGTLTTPTMATAEAQKIADAMNASGIAYAEGTAGKWTLENVKTMLGNETGLSEINRHLQAIPSREQVIAVTDATKIANPKHRATTSPESIKKSDARVANKRFRANEQLDVWNNQFPENMAEYRDMSLEGNDLIKKEKAKKLFLMANQVGGYAEPFVARGSAGAVGAGLEPDKYIIIKNHPEAQNYYAKYLPQDEAYLEWIKKYGRKY